jgi:hypothetical protein
MIIAPKLNYQTSKRQKLIIIFSLKPCAILKTQNIVRSRVMGVNDFCELVIFFFRQRKKVMGILRYFVLKNKA